MKFFIALYIIQEKVMKNFDENLIYKEFKRDDLEFFDVKSGKFSVFGLYDFFNRSDYVRMPISRAKQISVGVEGAAPLAAGGRICFKTNSKTVAIMAQVEGYHGANFSAIGLVGFDLCVKENGKFHRRKIFRPKDDPSLPYCGTVELVDGEKEILINMPNYGNVKSVKIGVVKGSYIENLNPYRKDIKPILYYGSSITQGGCASVPGNAYENIISRWNDVDFINLGFSGWAKAEPEMANYIVEQDISLFVYDYDHNAPTLEYYEQTHYSFYKSIRDRKPDLPILMVTRPDVEQNPKATDDSIAVALKSYKRAISEGDKNVYFINGYELFGNKDVDLCTTDGCHPNDLGFYRMAKVIGGKIDDILKLR